MLQQLVEIGHILVYCKHNKFEIKQLPSITIVSYIVVYRRTYTRQYLDSYSLKLNADICAEVRQICHDGLHLMLVARHADRNIEANRKWPWSIQCRVG